MFDYVQRLLGQRGLAPHGAERAAMLTGQLLTFSRKQTLRAQSWVPSLKRPAL